MYALSDKQIDYILNDISARGVEMESLQQNLLDHICCIIEQNLEVEGDFESFYQKTIKTFYKDALWEIEEETLILLTNKNYYTMKKIMIYSGAIAATAMSLGILFKFMHWPGASILIFLGIITSSFLFLPLLFTVKAKEQQSVKDKLIIGLGVVSGMLMSLSVLFKIMQWPYANKLAILSLLIIGLLFLPVYFFTGIRDAERKVNTITVSVLIIMVCGLWLTLIRSPQSSKMAEIRDTQSFLINEQIIASEKRLLENRLNHDSTSKAIKTSQQIMDLCQEFKIRVVEWETGQKKIEGDFESKDILLKDRIGIDPFGDDVYSQKLSSLIALIEDYNTMIGKKNNDQLQKITTRSSFIEYYPKQNHGLISVTSILNQLAQIQMIILQNEQVLIASK